MGLSGVWHGSCNLPEYMRKVGIPVWGDGVSTVFDFASRLVVAKVEGTREVHRAEVPLLPGKPTSRARRLVEQGVSVLICGAISRPLAALVSSAGIQIIPFVSGPVDRVLAAYLAGELARGGFLLPGYSPGARRRWRHGRGFRGREY